MKKTILITVALFILSAFKLDAKPEIGISLGFFYNSLRPYGEWIQLDNDLTIWRPTRVYGNWRPYSSGRWSWTSDGWYWDSYEPFGWATYHYGRWYDDDYYGWIWIPDYEWGPSWVEWRYDDDYIGWAPLPPYAGFRLNLGIHFSIGWHSHYSYWNFVDYNHFYDARVNRYFLDDRRCERIFGGTKYRTNYYSDRDRIVNGGIDRSFIERKGGYRINEREISNVDNFRDFERSRRDRGDRIYSYRPSDREVENGRTAEQYNIKRGENRSSIERDKINIPGIRNEGRSVTTERALGREREINSERDASRTERSFRSDQPRNQNSEQFRIQTERERVRIESENQRMGREERVETREPERVQRENPRERATFERQNKEERPAAPQRQIEERRQPNYERPAPRMERGNRESTSPRENSGNRDGRESGGSDRRRR